MKINNSIAKECGLKFSIVEQMLPTINSGGCGFFAKEAYTLLKSFGFDPKIIMLSRYSDDDYHDEIIESLNHSIKINRKPENFCIPNHLCVRVGKYYFDSTGVAVKRNNRIKLDYTWNILGEINIRQLNHMLKYKSSWNDEYSRKNNNVLKEIMKIIQKDLSIGGSNDN